MFVLWWSGQTYLVLWSDPVDADSQYFCLHFDHHICVPIVRRFIEFTQLIDLFVSSEKMIREARLSKKSSGQRQQTMDRVCLYLRLFMGMGVIWYFEIISWAAGAEQAKWTYFFDCFNMLQVVFCRKTLEKQ